MNKSKKIFEPIQIISIILIIISLIVLFFISKDVFKLDFSRQENFYDLDDGSIPQEEYEKWNTHTNSEMKYSFKYPQNWVLDETSTNQIFLYSESRVIFKSETSDPIRSNLKIEVYNSNLELPNNSTGLKLPQWVDILKESNTVKEVLIDGINSYEVISSYPNRTIYTQKENLIYSIFDDSPGKNIIQKQIVDSIQIK